MPLRTMNIAGLTLAATLVVCVPVQRAWGYTPTSPEVLTMIDKAVKLLEKEKHNEPGGMALIGNALLKAGVPPTHPKVQEAAAEVKKYVAEVSRHGLGNHTYNGTVCCLFLIELDPAQYRPEIEILLKGIAARQLPNGCWAYQPYTGYDDTSQAQYGVLAYWSAHVHGFPVEAPRVVSAMNWFMRVQDLGGGWTYRAKDPGSPQRVQQEAPTHSMSAAGAGSVYICGYLLGYGRRRSTQPAGTPSALKAVTKPDSAVYLSGEGADYETFKATCQRANNWFSTRTVYAMDDWTYYYMYALERYKAFQDLIEGTSDKEPKWYNDGVEFLRKTQTPEGGWVSGHYEAIRPVSTSFAVLFLTRSTAKSIQKLEGQLVGGKSLPTDLSDVVVNSKGQVVDQKERSTIEMLNDLESSDSFELDFSVPARLKLAVDSQQRESQLARLRRMVMRGPFEVRLMAVNTLGFDRNLENVPALIFALSDPDARVARAADSGLRFISRRFDGMGLSANPSAAEWESLQGRWAQWFLSVKPDGNLIE